MRVDLFLKMSRLEPRRSVAQQMCEAGAVKVNGARAKSSHTVRAGDQIAIRKRGRVTTVRVAEVPARPPSKAGAASLYETISVETYDAD
jgi:ribosomal 50S subunit-recycling heat shock protein